MPITVTCDCGKTLRVPDIHAGKKAKCPACEALVPIPKAEPEFEVVEDDPPPKPAPKKAAVVEDDDDEPKPKKKKPVAVADDDDDEPKPKKKKKRPRDDDDDDDRPRRRARARNDADTGKKMLYIIGGLLLLAGGIALAVYGYNHEGRGSVRAMVFGGFLALGGLGTTVQGVTGNFDDDE
jgi:hypothetical protein